MQEKQTKRQKVEVLVWFKRSKKLTKGDVYYVENIGLCDYRGDSYEDGGYLVFKLYDAEKQEHHVTSDQIYLASGEEKITYLKDNKDVINYKKSKAEKWEKRQLVTKQKAES